MIDSGLLIVVSGPSGAGKGTICDALREHFPNIHYSISEELLKEDAFLEHAKVYDHYYGTPKEYVYQMLRQGNHVMLEIDIQGAMQVKEKYPQGVFIYIVPPSKAVLEERLRGRHTDSDEVIAARLAKARNELEWIDKYDYVIVNDDLGEAIQKAAAVLKAEECRVMRNANCIEETKQAYQ